MATFGKPGVGPSVRFLDSDFDPQNPFNGDALSRRTTADYFTSILGRVADGCVICLDAPWGEGKTWFIKNWQTTLPPERFRSVYIDCFKHDHLEDPFLLVTSALTEAFPATAQNRSARSQVVAGAKKLGASLLPRAVRLGMDAVGAGLGVPGIGTGAAAAYEALSKATEDVAETAAEAELERLSGLAGQEDFFRRNLQSFLAGELTKSRKLVVFVDELDRATPTFSIRLLERLKHYFDCPGLIFVLSCHRELLADAIGGLYGIGEAGSKAYFDKFIHLTLRLPKQEVTGAARSLSASKVIYLALVQMGLNAERAEVWGAIAATFGLSLRTARRATQHAVLIGSAFNDSTEAFALVCMKYAQPHIYAGITERNRDAYQWVADAMLKTADRKGIAGTPVAWDLLKCHYVFRLCTAQPEDDWLNALPHSEKERPEAIEVINFFMRTLSAPRAYISRLASIVDLPSLE